MARDQKVPHLIPAPHLDFLYLYFKINIPNEKVSTVLQLTESIGYDTMTKEAYARCHTMAANVGSLYLIKQIALGDKSLLHAQQEYITLLPLLIKEEKGGKGMFQYDQAGPYHRAVIQYLFE